MSLTGIQTLKNTAAESIAGRYTGSQVRVLVIPGLRDSGRTHWQTWLQGQYRGAVRVKQAHWDQPDLDLWAAQIAKVIDRTPASTTWVAVAHSFGCLALARYLRDLNPTLSPSGGGVRSALLVAPADPVKFGVVEALSTPGLGLPATVIGSENDPWMPLASARHWAEHWGARFLNLGPVGHINTESGFGPWPLARFHVDQMIRDQQRQRRIERVHPMELNYAI
ncbi:MAG: alpha/beta hydrolase [Rubrivivax sp.]|nr:MAG: alpha/beta hydrolase [Rubrivivax sp.]